MAPATKAGLLAPPSELAIAVASCGFTSAYCLFGPKTASGVYQIFLQGHSSNPRPCLHVLRAAGRPRSRDWRLCASLGQLVNIISIMRRTHRSHRGARRTLVRPSKCFQLKAVDARSASDGLPMAWFERRSRPGIFRARCVDRERQQATRVADQERSIAVCYWRCARANFGVESIDHTTVQR
jgi:hypothetical protein